MIIGSPSGNMIITAPRSSRGIVENPFVIDISNNIPAQILFFFIIILMIFILIKLLCMLFESSEEN